MMADQRSDDSSPYFFLSKRQPTIQTAVREGGGGLQQAIANGSLS